MTCDRERVVAQFEAYQASIAGLFDALTAEEQRTLLRMLTTLHDRMRSEASCPTGGRALPMLDFERAGREPAAAATNAAAEKTTAGEHGRMPALYLGHGAPTLLDDQAWPAELAAWARALPRPRAILTSALTGSRRR